MRNPVRRKSGPDAAQLPMRFALAMVMKGESGVAYKLINTLSDGQKRVAIVSNKRGGMATAAGKHGVVPEPEGFDCKEFDKKQPLKARRGAVGERTSSLDYS